MEENRDLDTIFEKKKSGKMKKVFFLILFLAIIAFSTAALAPLSGRTEDIQTKERTTLISTADIEGDGAKRNDTLSIFMNGVKLKDISSNDFGLFTFSIALKDGENLIEVSDSTSKTIYREKITYLSPGPNLDIISPNSGETVDKEEILVKGKTDDGGTKVFINDKEVIVKDGFFEEIIILTKGDNLIQITANNGTKKTEEEIYIKYDDGSKEEEKNISENNSNTPAKSNSGSSQNGGSSNQSANMFGGNSLGGSSSNNNGSSNPDPQPVMIYPSKVIISYLKYAADSGGNGEDEFIEVRNTGGENKDISGWSVSDSDGHVFVFPSFMLNVGATVRINTGKGGFSFQTSDSVWDRVGEAAYLRDSAGRTVDIYSY